MSRGKSILRARATITLLALAVSLLVAPIFIGNVQASGCITPPGCQLNTDTNVPSNDGTIKVEQDNDPTKIYALPHLFYFGNYSVHSIQVLNLTFTGATSRAHYVWKQWTVFGNRWTYNPNMTTPTPGILYNYTGTNSFYATFDKQFQLSLSFTDPSGQAINPPSSLTLTVTGGTATTTLNSYSNQWVNANMWTVTSVTWEGFTGPTYGTQTIDLTSGSTTKAIPLLAYPASLQIVDRNNNPVSGASVIVSFANQTAATLTSDSKGNVPLGHIPQGSFSARVTYQNQDQGTWSLTAINTPTNTIQLNTAGGGTSATATTSGFVLLTIFAVAFFLILLAIKVRRSSPPPTI